MTSGLPVIEARDKANLVELKKRQNPAKNLFGATSYLYRLAKNAHDGFRHSPDGSASYSAFTDFLGHKDLGEKTILFIIDGPYGNDNVDGPLTVNGRCCSCHPTGINIIARLTFLYIQSGNDQLHASRD